MRKILVIALFLSLFVISNSVTAQELTPEQRKEVTDFMRKVGATEEQIKKASEEKMVEAYNALQGMKANPIFQHMQKRAEEKKKAKEGINDVEYAKNLEISNFIIRYFDKEKFSAGVESIKIKNNGNKTVKAINITIYFKDKNNIIIHESDISLSTAYSLYKFKALKPNYIFNYKMDSLYHPFENMPSEWQEGNFEYKIKDIILE